MKVLVFLLLSIFAHSNPEDVKPQEISHDSWVAEIAVARVINPPLLTRIDEAIGYLQKFAPSKITLKFANNHKEMTKNNVIIMISNSEKESFLMEDKKETHNEFFIHQNAFSFTTYKDTVVINLLSDKIFYNGQKRRTDEDITIRLISTLAKEIYGNAVYFLQRKNSKMSSLERERFATEQQIEFLNELIEKHHKSFTEPMLDQLKAEKNQAAAINSQFLNQCAKTLSQMTNNVTPLKRKPL